MTQIITQDRETTAMGVGRTDSFREYLLVAQDRPHIEHFVRQPDNTWLFSETNDLDHSILLPAIGCQLKVREVYDKVDELELEGG